MEAFFPKFLKRLRSLLQHHQHILQFDNHLPNHLFVLGRVILGFIPRQAQPRTADGEALVIQQRPDLPDHQHVLALIIPAVTAALHRVKLGKLLLPVTEHVRFYRTKLAHFTNGEVAFAWNRRKLVVMTWFQHRPQLGLSTSALDER